MIEMREAVNRKVFWHCFWRVFSFKHRIIYGFQHGYRICYCKCGFYYPRLRDRSGEANDNESKFLTNTNVRDLFDGMRKQ